MNIVFYDGQCGLCQRSIQILLKCDRHKKLLFAPINGETFKKYFNRLEVDPDTVIFFDGADFYKKSSAFFAIANALGGVFKLLNIFKIFSNKLLNLIYDFVASRRTQFSCKLLPYDERFLP